MAEDFTITVSDSSGEQRATTTVTVADGDTVTEQVTFENPLTTVTFGSDSGN